MPGQLANAMATDFVVALLFFPASSLRRRLRTVVLASVITVIALSPLWVPAGGPLNRAFAMLWAIALMAKLYDLNVGATKSSRPDFWAYLAFLPNIFSIVWRKLDAEPRPSTRENLGRLLKSSGQMALAAGPLIWLFHLNWQGVPFFVEHCAKVFAFFCS